MWVFEIVGMIVVLSFGLFFLLLLTYYLIVRPVDAAINTEGMPKLTPIPIPTKNRSFLMRLLVWFFEVRKWELSQDWSFRLEGGPEIVIPRGFHFDGASIPRPLWGILSPIGLLLIPGLVHDYGYKYDQLWMKDEDNELVAFQKGAGRSYWDSLFLEVGKQVNGFAAIDWSAWLAIKIAGGGVWNKHRDTNEPPQKPEP